MQVAFYLAGEITQVLDAIPWVRCASGNVFLVEYFSHPLLPTTYLDQGKNKRKCCLEQKGDQFFALPRSLGENLSTAFFLIWFSGTYPYVLKSNDHDLKK